MSLNYQPPAALHPGVSLAPLQRAILLTVLYADLFDYPLTEGEIYRDLITSSPSRPAFLETLASLEGTYLARSQGNITWVGRERLAALRRQRQGLAQAIWPWARRYGRWLAWVPFVRMVAISGSLAVDNVEPDADIDAFIITESSRLWFARLWLVAMRVVTHRLGFLFPHAFCPNYIVTMDGLQVERQSLYTAHEAAQMVPLWGESAYGRFLAANRWVLRFLPNAAFAGRRPPMQDVYRPALTCWIERLLGGRLGDRVDSGLYRLFLLFHRLVRAPQLARRLEADPARREAFRRQYLANLQAAFQPQRQEIVEGGYARAVGLRFTEQAGQHLGLAASSTELENLFPAVAAGEPESGDRIYNQAHHVRAFQERYGNA